MARTYVTKTDDMLDLICFRYYNKRQIGAVEAVLEANHAIGLAAYGPRLPRGITITLPDLPDERTVPTVKLWD